MNREESIILSHISSNPSMISDPVALARQIKATGVSLPLPRIIKLVKDRIAELLVEEQTEGYQKIVMSHQSIRTKVDREYGGSCIEASKSLNIPVRTLQRWYNKPQSINKDIKRFVVTYAQNDTPVHLGFYNSILKYSKENNAEIIVYRGKYRNPTSIIEADKENISYDPKVRPFLLDSHRELNDKLVIYPAHTSPTAARPLSGFDTHTGDKSGIFPHPKVQLKTVPTPSSSLPKILTTTGAITIANYSESKAGEKGKHHHVIGALVVEIVDEKKFHIRHIGAEEDGSFYDIAGGEVKKYTPMGIEKGHEIDVWVGGDIHYPFVDKMAMQCSFDQIRRFKPSNIFLHDILDCWAVNHHERGNRFLNTAKMSNGVMDIEKEVDGAVELIRGFNRFEHKPKVNIVPSNHDDALDRWLHDEKLENLGINAPYFHYLSWKKHLSAKSVSTGFSFIDAFQFSAKEKLDACGEDVSNINFLKRDVPKIINNIDYSFHGDIGSGGARGSALGFSKIGIKTVIGHSHQQSIVDGCYQVGVNSLIPLGYAKGASGWTHTNCITYKNGKRTLINSIDGQYYLK